jgi:predicted amidohydrolase YtcJ
MEATLVLLNGKVYTMDDENPRAEAVAIDGSRIIAVGETTEVRRLVGDATRVLDLQGKTVIPGLIDCHIHFLAYALRAQEVDVDGTASLQEALAKVAARVASAKPGEWIVGGGWDKNRWPRGSKPSKEDLDGVAANHPVALASKDGHTLWVNSLALAQASITRATPSPPGGEIERDADTGDVTGLLKENAIALIQAVLPEPTVEEAAEAVKPAIQIAHTLGVTSIHVPEGRKAFQAFQRLLARGDLHLRVTMLLPAESLDAATAVGVRTGFGNERLRVGMVKVFADGSLGSQTAAMLEPYEGDPGNRGILVLSREELRRVLATAVTHGLGVAVHAIGDRANRVTLDVIEDVAAVAAGRPTRWRIEHAQHITPMDRKRFQRLGVIASVQPSHIALDMDLAETRLGSRSREAYPLRSLRDQGVRLAFGSDGPVMPMNPLLGIYTAVTRKRVTGQPPGGWHPEERITVEDAVRAYTLNAAYASGEERNKGSIEAGKLADLVVLSRDIFEASEAALLDTRVEMTVFDGAIVYEADPSPQPQAVCEAVERKRKRGRVNGG